MPRLNTTPPSRLAAATFTVCEAGTIATYCPGIAPADAALVRDLPHRLLPSGCTNPQAPRSVIYARAFNEEIVRWIKQGKQR